MYSPDLVEFTGDILPHTRGNEYYGHHASYGMTTLDGGCRKSYALSRRRDPRVAEPVHHVEGPGAIRAGVRQGLEGSRNRIAIKPRYGCSFGAAFGVRWSRGSAKDSVMA
jgi:hypothetical protein